MQRNVQAGFYRRLILSLIVFLLVCSQAYAYTDWKAISPGGGGWCMGVFPHPTEPKTVWLTTDISGLFKSTDGGATFENKVGAILIAEGGQSNAAGHLTQFAIDPTQTNVCYYASHTNGNLWRSADSGETWSKLPDTMALAGAAVIVDRQGTLLCVKKDMQTGDANASGELWVSSDGGKTFAARKIPFSCAVKSRTLTMRLAVSQSNRLYASNPLSRGKGLYYTEDKGVTWHPIDVLKEKTVGAIACSPTKRDLTVAVCSDGSIYHAADGKNFSLSTGKTMPAPTRYDGGHKSVGIGISKDGSILAGVMGSRPLFKSTDDGKTFTVITPTVSQEDWRFNTNAGGGIAGFAASPCGEAFYRTTSINLMASPDGGEHWAVRCKGIELLGIRAAVVDVSDPNRVHFVASDNGHFYTTDLGATQKNWFSGEPGFCGGVALAQDPNHPEIFYKLLSFPNGDKGKGIVLKSTDRGASWERTNPKQDLASRYRTFGTVIVDPKDSNHIYVSSCTPKYEYGKAAEAADPIYSVLESTDAGVNFTPMKESPKSLRRLILCDSGNIYGVQGYFTQGCPAFKYDKATQKWSVIYESGVSDLEVSKQDENVLLLADNEKGEVMKSTDGGKTWVAKKDMNGKGIFARSVYIDPVKPSYMLAAARNVNGGYGGVLRSTDAGETWHPLNKDYQRTHIIGFTYGGVPGRVYLRTCGSSAARMDELYDDKYTGGTTPAK